VAHHGSSSSLLSRRRIKNATYLLAIVPHAAVIVGRDDSITRADPNLLVHS
jgi:hypothetical protein